MSTVGRQTLESYPNFKSLTITHDSLVEIQHKNGSSLTFTVRNKEELNSKALKAKLEQYNEHGSMEGL